MAGPRPTGGGDGGGGGGGGVPPPPPSDEAVTRVIHNLIAYMSKHGRSFEAVVKQKNAHDPKFRSAPFRALHTCC